MRTQKTKGSLRGLLMAAALLASACAAVNACSASGQSGSSFDGEGGSPGGGGSPTSGGSGGGGSGMGGGLFNDAGTPTGAGGGLDPDAACATVSATAEASLQPADIIIAVDTSGSMDEESAEVQANLNNFATIIANSGIDVHVVLIADSSVCIPPPLGSGACNGADEQLPNYRHVPQGVGSTNALQLFLSTYPEWKSSLRANATKTFAVVSDDESDLSAADFTNQLLALDPPTFQGFKFDAIVASDAPTPFDCFNFGGAGCPAGASQCCGVANGICMPLSADEGKVYKNLVQQTGGVFGDLCLQDFDPVFQDMATGVVKDSKLSCDYTIPPVPDGETFEPGKVNVMYTPTGGAAEPIYNVPGGAADCGMKGGWYYDDPGKPTKILMCPSTCTVLQADATGKIDILFGCATEIVPS